MYFGPGAAPPDYAALVKRPIDLVKIEVFCAANVRCVVLCVSRYWQAKLVQGLYGSAAVSCTCLKWSE